MKMFGKNSISKLLYYVTMAVVIGYGVFIGFVAFALITNRFELTDDNRFKIKILFVDSYVMGALDGKTIVVLLLFLAYYLLYFLLLLRILKAFKSDALFTNSIIKRLDWFTYFNLLFPVATFIGVLIMGDGKLNDEVVYGMFHILIAIFSGFISAIFKQGFQLQQENDLTI
ncbi:DUF2975 domain-containing protein [Spongiivirga citrea]|uniref:DUF2975 domain-containing protein n=1 Tax=Spongiivirga citrea TaxID=1481457 RepID=A0A6M0CM48_9FLAO|nr:DUF2975 domain-containing protein [Spongiivirga citrea]NER17114.1 DUF2975 domain-containing protein [Spongiivirga citrea]